MPSDPKKADVVSAAKPRATYGPASEAETRLGWRMAGLAFTMASEVTAGSLLGLMIDHFAKTPPRWLLIGAITGIAVGMLSFIRGAVMMNRLVSKQERDRAARGIAPPPPLKDETPMDGDSWDKDWPDNLDDLDTDTTHRKH
jgi:F0F1-type ATP synthase assembly protein I